MAKTYYDMHARELFDQYRSVDSHHVHQAWTGEHLRPRPGIVCDIGAGSGRDANWLADLGWDVVAVEPNDSLRELALNDSRAGINWLRDSLPGLNELRSLGHRFDLILASAVWMHLSPNSRQRAFRVMSEMLRPGGKLVLSLRHGLDESENRERGFFPVDAEETLEYARSRALVLAGRYKTADLARDHVEWETLVFELPDDGSGSLALLRHVIVNDDKAASHKLGLLRVLTRIAEGAPGMVVFRSDSHVEIPLGAVGLYWLKQYKPLLHVHKIPVTPSASQGVGFAKQAFADLRNVSNYDLRVGARLGVANAAIVVEAIRDACRNITQMPVRYITYPGRQQQIFDYEWASVRAPRQPVLLSREFLSRFGYFRIPADMWQAMGQYACWLEPAILREWSALTAKWKVANYRPTPLHVFDWEEGRRDTTVAASRVTALRESGEAVPCTWSARKPDKLEIDHCFPWARWFNNDLWNLVPASSNVNASKGDKLPSAVALADAQDRIIKWWDDAYIQSPMRDRFLTEVESSLPGLDGGVASLGAVHAAIQHQRARLKADQQLVEWSFR